MSPEAKLFLEKNKGKIIVFTNGCFDIIHAGHVQYLKEASSLGDILFIGLNSDSSVKRLKGPERPINYEQERKFVLENIKGVAFVEIFEEDTPLSLIKSVVPQVLVKGGDWSEDQIVGSSFVKESGGKTLSLSFKDGFSTTKIIDKIKE